MKTEQLSTDAHDQPPLKKAEVNSASADKPTYVTAIGIMLLFGAGTALIVGGLFAASFVGLLYPGTYFSFALAIIAGLRGTKLLGRNAADELPPTTIAWLQIANVINFDVVNVVLGITTLVLLRSTVVKDYLRSL